MSELDLACPRCGRSLKGVHDYRGERCADKVVCPSCRMHVYVNADNRLAAHKVYDPSLGRVVRCPGVGRSAATAIPSRTSGPDDAEA